MSPIYFSLDFWSYFKVSSLLCQFARFCRTSLIFIEPIVLRQKQEFGFCFVASISYLNSFCGVRNNIVPIYFIEKSQFSSIGSTRPYYFMAGFSVNVDCYHGKRFPFLLQYGNSVCVRSHASLFNFFTLGMEPIRNHSCICIQSELRVLRWMFTRRRSGKVNLLSIVQNV